jgi:hypothetical protein
MVLLEQVPQMELEAMVARLVELVELDFQVVLAVLMAAVLVHLAGTTRVVAFQCGGLVWLVMAQLELFGQAILVHSHQLTQGIYKWNFIFKFATDSLLSIQSLVIIFVRLFL